jgi:aerobic-type carbon monoxide dehydrogenase small subunit (CoxS/CutS family)
MITPKQIAVTINGERRALSVDPDELLLALLRRLGFKGVKGGCHEGVCGACTVILDGRAVNSCHVFACQADGRSIQTIESLGTFEKPHPLQTAMVEEAGVQCGFCTPGVILSVKALLDEKPGATMDDIREHCDGNLCRCTGYEKIENAIQRVLAGGQHAGNPKSQIPNSK